MPCAMQLHSSKDNGPIPEDNVVESVVGLIAVSDVAHGSRFSE